MADFIVWGTFESIWSSFAANPGVFGGPRDATISPTDDGNINVGQGDEFTFVGIPAGPNAYVGPAEIRSFTMSNGGTALWMVGVGNSGGILIPTNEIAYNTFNSGSAFTITSNTVISSFPYADIFVPAMAGAVDAVDDGFTLGEDVSATLSVLSNDSGTGISISGVTQGANGGLVQISGTSVSYNPNGAFDYLAVGETATDTFTYTITDGSTTDTATVTVTITGANDAPQLAGNSGATQSESTVNNGLNSGGPAFFVTDVDVSDVVTGSVTNVVQSGDKAGVLSDALLLSIAKYVSNVGGPLIDATETSSPASVFRFNRGSDNDPTRFDFLQAGDVLTLTYTVTATDSQGASDSATVTLNITGENDDPIAVDDSGMGFGTDEDTAFTTANVLANDTDVDMGDILSVSAFDATSAGGALITSNADGTFNYNPNGAFDYLAVGETATDTFTYTITDGSTTDTATVTVTITGANDAPVLMVQAYGGTEDLYGTTRIFANAFSVTDVDVSDIVTATLTGVTQSGDKAGVVSDADILSHFTIFGGATVIGNGATTVGGVSIQYSPNGDPLFQFLQQGELLTYNIFITVTDGNGGTDTASVAVSVAGVNDAPDAVDDSGMGFVTTEDGGFFTGNVLDNDYDVDMGDTFSVTAFDAVSAGGGTVSYNFDGTFTYGTNGMFDYLAAGESTTDTFTYTITDNNGATDTATVSILINGVNDAPDLTIGVLGVTVSESTINSGLTASGPNPDLVDPDVTDVVTGSISGVVQTGDKAGVLTDAEILAFSSVVDNLTDSSILLDGTETSSGDVTIRVNFGADNNSSRFDFLQAGDSLTLAYTIVATDSQGASDSQTIRVTINGENDDPVAVDDSGMGFTTNENNFLVTANVLTNDSDPDMGDTLTIIDFDSTTTLGATVTTLFDGTFNYFTFDTFQYLAVGETATDTFTYTVSDENGGTDTATVSILITGVNDAPELTILNFFIPDEDLFNSSSLGFPNAFQVTDVDTSDVVTASITGVTQSGDKAGVVSDAEILSHFVIDVPDEMTVIGAGETDSGPIWLTYTANGAPLFQFLQAGDVLTFDLTIMVSDGNGGVDTAVVTTSVSGVNDDPDAVDDSGMGFGTDEDTAFTTANVLANDTDVDMGDTFSVTSFDGTSAGGATITSNGDGTFNYNPNGMFEYLAVGESTTDTFTYTITDNNGASDTATVTVTITGVNDAPTANDDVATTDEDNPSAPIDVLANDTDPDLSDTLSILSFDDSGTMGSVALNMDGTFTYDPDGQFEYLAVGETATDTFEYTVSDGNGGSDTATVTVTITGVNDAPTANDDYCYFPEGDVITGNVLMNDTDPDASDVLTATLVSGVSRGFLSFNSDGSFTYTPLFASAGVEEFTYMVDDGNGGTDIATVVLVFGTFNGGVIIGDSTAEIFPGLGEDLYGSDFIDGRGGDDIIFALTGNDTLEGGRGDDTIVGGMGDDLISGQADNDIIIGDSGSLDQFKGPDGNDTINAGSGDDFIAGQGGDDDIRAGSGNDQVEGNDGDDTLRGGWGDDTVCGQDGDDRVFGNGGNDILSGDAGNDFVRGGGNHDLMFLGTGNDRGIGDDGNDTILGGAGNDSIEGGLHMDLIFGGDGVDTLRGDEGNDELVGGNETGDGDDIDGGDGNDTIFGQGGIDNLQGGAGHDLVLGGDDWDDIDGGSGNDTLLGEDGDDDVDGGAGNDKLFGQTGADSLNGNDGDDYLDGDEGDDDLRGGQGNDYLIGGGGNDSLSGTDNFDVESGFFGDDGRDTLFGLGGDDVLIGANGNDYLDGGAGTDTLNGGAGNDTLLGGTSADTITGGSEDDLIDGGGGSDLITGDGGRDTLLGGAGNDTLDGGEGVDCIDGEQGDDEIAGGVGNDTIDGGVGNDSIDGGDGRDLIQAGSGDDRVDGGSGNDTIDSGGADSYALINNGGVLGGDYVLGGSGDDIIFTSTGGFATYIFDGEGGRDVLIGADDPFSENLLFGGEQDDLLVVRQGLNLLYGEEGADKFIIPLTVTTSTDGSGNVSIVNIDATGDFAAFISDFDGNQPDKIIFDITWDGDALSGDVDYQLNAVIDNFVSVFSADAGDYFLSETVYEEGGFIDPGANGLLLLFQNGSYVYIDDLSPPGSFFQIGDVQSLNGNEDYSGPLSFQGFWQTDEELIVYRSANFDFAPVDGVDKSVTPEDPMVMDPGTYEPSSDDFDKPELIDIFNEFLF